MTKRKLLVVTVLFLLYEALVWALLYLFLSDSNYLLAGFVLTVCGLTVLVVYLVVARSQQRGDRLPDSAPASSAQPSAGALADEGEREAVLAFIHEANEHLAKSRTLASQRSKSSLTDFPLYFLLGSEGCGKTSLFLGSKADPELLAGQVYRESAVVPTGLGNIWFAGGSVIVEGGGSFFSGDLARWNQFLGFFCRSRVKSWLLRIVSAGTGTNLGGVVLCCDASSFIGVPDSARLAALARQSQQRLRAVGEMFGADFPVYVVFTKSDAIPYFGDYFGRLSEVEDQQVLGCVLEGGAGQNAALRAESETRISNALNKLYLSLADRRLPFLRRETNPAKKPKIYEFPRELKRIRGSLVQFLVDSFHPNPLQPNPQLKGFYFSGTRKISGSALSAAGPDQSTIHRVGDVTRILRAEDIQQLRAQIPETDTREPEITRWAFSADLWRQILDPARSGGRTVYVDRRSHLARSAALAAVTAISAIAMAFFANSYIRNRSFLHEIQSAAAHTEPIPPGGSLSIGNLMELEAMRTNAVKLAEYGDSHPPRLMQFGFYKGDIVRDPAWRLYLARFRQYFLNGIARDLENRLTSVTAGQTESHPYEAVYSDLKAYRTITRSPERSCAPDSALTETLLAVWQRNHTLEPEAERIVRRNIQLYVDSLKRNLFPAELEIGSRDDAVQRARTYLNAFNGYEAEYHQIVDQASRELVNPARLENLTGDANYRQALRAGVDVPGAFTRAGWVRVMQLIDSAGEGTGADSCVLGSVGGQSAGGRTNSDMKSQVRQIYINEYIQRWSGFLAGANVLPYAGCRDGAMKLSVLKDNNSPILAVLLLTAENTSFPAASATTNTRTVDNIQKVGKGLLDRFSFRHGKLADVPLRVPVNRTANVLNEDEITKTFQPVHAMFEAAQPNRSHWVDKRNEGYLNALGDLQRAVQGLDHGGKCDESDQPANSQATTEMAKALSVTEALERNFDNQGVYGTVKALIESPIRNARNLINTDPLKTAKDKIDGAQQAVCNSFNAIRNKYPFDPQGEDADLGHVAAVFSPKSGRLADLRHELSDSTPKLSQQFRTFLTRAEMISAALFIGQSDVPAMKYKLLVRENPGLKRVSGTLNGESISMAEREYAWPTTNPGIDLRVELAGGGSAPLRSYSGVWGIFQLFNGADERGNGSDLFKLINLLAGKKSNLQSILPDASAVVFEVKQFPNGVQQAFDKDFFRLSCPARATE